MPKPPIFDLKFPNPVDRIEDFFDREVEHRKLDSIIERGLPRPVVILGERRIGKTSFHRVSKPKLSRLGFPAVSPYFADYTLDGFTGELLREACYVFNVPPQQTGMIDSKSVFRWTAAADYIPALRKVLRSGGDQPLVVSMDEFDSFILNCGVAEGRRILRFVQDMVEAPDLPLKFFFTMTQTSEQAKSGYPSGFLSESDIIELHPFDRAETDLMVSSLSARQLQFTAEALELYYRSCGGYPYFAKLILEHLLAAFPQGNETATITPQHFNNILPAALKDGRPEIIITNILDLHMSHAERAVLSELVRVGRSLSGDQMRGATVEMSAAAQGLVRRGYLSQTESGEYYFRLGYLEGFLKLHPLLLISDTRELHIGEKGQVYRGQYLLDLDPQEARLVSFLFEKRLDLMVSASQIFDRVYPDQVAASERRIRIVKDLVESVRKKLEDDWRKPYYLVDAGTGYRLVNLD